VSGEQAQHTILYLHLDCRRGPEIADPYWQSILFSSNRKSLGLNRRIHEERLVVLFEVRQTFKLFSSRQLTARRIELFAAPLRVGTA
jgi:hypothetical protein